MMKGSKKSRKATMEDNSFTKRQLTFSTIKNFMSAGEKLIEKEGEERAWDVETIDKYKRAVQALGENFIRYLKSEQ